MERIQPIPNLPDPYYGARVNQAPETEEEGGQFDIRAFLQTLWRGKWIIAICVLFAIVVGYLTSSQQPPVYRASAKVMFDIPRANVEVGREVVDRTSLAGSGLQNQIEILRSTSLTERVVDELRLDRDPRFNPALRPPPEPWTAKYPIPPEVEDLLVTIGLVSIPGPPPDPEVMTDRRRRVIVQNVQNGLRLQPIPNSQVIEIGYVTGDPDLAARIVNAFADQYIVDQLEGKLETFRSATEWLTDRVAQLQDRVETAEAEVLNAQARIAEQAGASLDGIRQQLAALTAARGQARDQASQLSARYNRLEEALAGGAAIGTLPELRDSPAISALRAREGELLARDDDLSNTLLPSHPSRARIAEDLEKVRAEIRAEAVRILASLGVDLDVAREREAQLDSEIRALEEQELQLSTESVEIGNLEREAQASRMLYENLLARLQESNAQEDLQTADARILTPAQPPLGPINTTQNRTLSMSLFLGAALGIGLVLLLDRMNNTFRSPQQLEQMLGHSVLATIPAAGPRMKRSDVVQVLRDKPNSSLAESVRNLRTSILFSNVDHPPRVVMFSSSVPREGKSTTSMLVALTSRQMGKSAIIVDCDLRMPALSKVLQVQSETPGLLSVINETSSVEEAIYVEPETGLHVLMTRPGERMAKINAADILASTKFKHLVEELARTYDLVVLDTPPTLVVSDARIVSPLADAVVFCTRWDSTPRAAVKEGLRELTSVRAPIIGVAMTMVNESRASKYSYDGYSYYKGRYRDYYEA